MKIRQYNGENKLTRKNIISVAKAFYDGLSYDKEYAPAGWDFEPGARLVDLGTGIKKEEGFSFEKELSQFDRWKEKNEKIYHIAKEKMDKCGLMFMDVIFLPRTYEGSVNYYEDCHTHWIPTICAFDEYSHKYVFEENTLKWYSLKVEQMEYDVPCEICERGTDLGMGAFVRFLSGLIFF